MSKATLQFTLPEERQDFQTALNGENYRASVNEMLEYLRNEVKYNNDLNSEKIYLLEDVREKFVAILADNGVEP
jgi:hypothetical protein